MQILYLNTVNFLGSFLELLRVLKQDGILYINAPSNGDFHRGSHVDVYRFYPDAGKALEKWGKDNNYKNLKMLSLIPQFK